MTEALPEAGVNEWRVNNRAVRELVEKHPWFEAMAVVIGRGIVKTAHWGLMGRVVFGALVSMSDLATDCAVLWQVRRKKSAPPPPLLSLTAHVVTRFAPRSTGKAAKKC